MAAAQRDAEATQAAVAARAAAAGQASLAGRCARRAMERTREEKHWVACDLLLHPEAYAHVTEAEART